jgi:glycine oxidase
MRIAIVGGGVIGLACAWRLAGHGIDVVVYDSAPESQEASWAAAGMLAPHHEADRADALWRLGVASLARWPDFAAELFMPVDFHQRGGLIAAIDETDAALLDAKQTFATANGIAAVRYSDQSLRKEEPHLSGCREALLLPGAQVNPRHVTTALRHACSAVGVDLRYGTSVTSLDELADIVVLAGGAWTPALARLAGLEVHGEPVKGQMLRFDSPDGLLQHFIHCHHAYLVPRAGAGIVVGSTMVWSGFDKSEDAAAIERLADNARRLLPALRQATIAETWTGLRPRLNSGLPVIAQVRKNLVLATGHFRNGILLTPITADAVVELCGGPACGVDLSPFTLQKTST